MNSLRKTRSFSSFWEIYFIIIVDIRALALMAIVLLLCKHLRIEVVAIVYCLCEYSRGGAVEDSF